MSLPQLFAQILRVPSEELSDASSPATIAGWDSMATMKLVAALEETYDISLTTDEIRHFTSLGSVRSILATRGLS